MSQTFLYISLLPLFLIGVGIIIVVVLFIFLAPLVGLGSLSMYLERKTKAEKIILVFVIIVSFLAASYPYWDEFISTGIPPADLLKMGFMFLIYAIVTTMITGDLFKHFRKKYVKK